MRDRERTVVTLLVLLMLTVWLGFLLHRSTRFAGSLAGGVLGVSGTILMLVPLAAYCLVKRVQAIKRFVTGWAALQVSLTPTDKAIIERKPTDSVEAYDLFLKGRSRYFLYTEEHLHAAAEFLARAIEIDPKFADAYGYLS